MRLSIAAARTVIFLFFAFLTLAATELVLIATDYRYSPLDIETRQPAGSIWNNPYDARLLHAIGDDRFVFDPDLIWRSRAGADPFNRQGFRGPLLSSEKPPGEFRVFALGDSNTLGWGGPEGANWPQELQRLLGAPGAPFLVINASAHGYTSFQGLRRLEETLPYRPDLVMVSFGSNDAHPVAVTDARFVASALGARVRLLSMFRLGQLFLATWDRVKAAESASRVARVPLPDYEENLRRMAEISRQRGITCVLLTRPYIGTSSDPGFWKSYATDYRKQTLAIAAAENLPGIDLYAWFENQLAYFADESHFFPEGHRVAAHIIRRQLAGPLQDRGIALPNDVEGLPDRLELDAGEAEARPFLGSGFSGDERNQEMSFVWSDGLQSLLMASLNPAPGDYELSILAGSFAPLGEVDVEVSVNQLAAGRLRFGQRLSRARLELPAGSLRWGPNTIAFRYSAVQRPRDVDPGSHDSRELALRFVSIGLAPVQAK